MGKLSPSSRGNVRSVFVDLAANRGVYANSTLDGIARTIATARFTAVFLHRCASRAGARSSALAGLIKQFNQFLTGADIAWQADIRPGLILFHPNGVVIGPYCKIGASCSLQQGVTIGGGGGSEGGEESSPIVGDHVMFGAGAKVFGLITIGEGARIGANAVVVSSIPAGKTAIGVPATWR